MRTIFTWLLLAATAATVAACCGSVSCDCQGSSTDAITIRFDVDSLRQQFYASDVDSIYLRRIPRDSTQALKPDSVLLVRTRATAGQPIIINNSVPLAANGTRNISAYRYVIRLASRLPSKTRPTMRSYKRYFINKVQIDGRFQADGCCTCYSNTNKVVYFNNQAYDQTSAGQNDVVLRFK